MDCSIFGKTYRNVGIDDGFQWIAGSFMEDCESNRASAEDVDIVTLLGGLPNIKTR